MFAEIITIGDEILIGQIIDTNSAFISKALNKIGVEIYQITSVQDNKQHILTTLKEAQSRADIVIVTGGLGPTKDDITKQTFCEFFEDTLVENDEVSKNIYHLFSKYFNKKPLPSNLQQALVPSKAIVFQNEHGTAPGMWMEKNNTVFVSLPGVPYEMKYLLNNKVIPFIIKRFSTPYIYHKTLLTYGEGESTIANRISDWEENLPRNIKLAYLPSLGRVRLRLSAKGENEIDLKKSIDSQMSNLHSMLNNIAIGYEEETSIVEKIGAILVKNKKSLSLAESCTGGAIASEITSVPGISSFYRGSIIPYATDVKTSVLGIPPEIISKNGVVSIQVAEAMSTHATKVFNTDYAIATTGVAGPLKGDSTEEVGTVCIAIATPEGVLSEKFLFGKSRERIIKKAVNKSLEMLLKEISKN